MIYHHSLLGSNNFCLGFSNSWLLDSVYRDAQFWQRMGLDMLIARSTMKQLRKAAILLMTLGSAAQAQDHLPYTTYTSFSQVLEASNARYPALTRVSDPRPGGQPAYTGF